MSSEAVIVWGEVLWDRFPDGDQLGGAPANVAWHLGQAGGWCQLVTRVGDDADGRRAIERLGEVVDTTLVQVDPDRLTGEVLVKLDGAEPRYMLVPGRAWERIACPLSTKLALAEAGIMVYGTLAQRRPEGLSGWREAIGHTDALMVCDLNLRPTDQPAQAIEEALAAASIVKVNDRELATLREWFGWVDPIAALRTRPRGRSGAGARLVVVTHGADGSTLHGEHGAIEIAGEPAEHGGDNVGCGDAYLAILVHGLSLGHDLTRSARAASRWAAAVASVRGATPRFDDERIADLLELA